ncbi:alpha/beta fold hydrolase [Microbulbifer spongiae]|uniref:Alpha/beta fold hydrolase n=1 Tax=Microbulbifer spongiae TaxID=2944933 RepID=A0ABY9EB31_9GAMM|nr:alpha/beta fold hydrolase [Microbulbifer sp. MI-G]WKD49675.1 alpha/beta fold hydrolase [Microbulbifer sp. MI-G]
MALNRANHIIGGEGTTNMTETRITNSADGTPIAFEVAGVGDPIVLVEPAGHFRGFSAFDELRPLLTDRFTVYSFDRRGRGDSGDASVYYPSREVEDLAVILGIIERPAFVYGYSSGALLALHCAAKGLPIQKLALLEPPLQAPGSGPDPLTQELAVLVGEGRYADAVEYFHLSIGVPAEHVTQMQGSEAFEKMTVIAPTLVYDCRISEATDAELLGAVHVPTLVLDSQGSTDNLTGWAASVARQLPNATHRSLPGQWHSGDSNVLAAALVKYFQEPNRS